MSVLSNTGIRMGASAAGGDSIYVEDVFGMNMYDGNGGEHEINNGVDLAGEGGLVWIKNRTQTERHSLFDTVRGKEYTLATNENSGPRTRSFVDSFDNDGFTLDTNDGEMNNTTHSYVSWAYRKCPGFFDIVTYTGTGSNQTVAHNLDSVPGLIIIKITSSSDGWHIYHRSVGAGKFLRFEDGAEETRNYIWNDTAPTATHFSLGTDNGVNKDDETYVAYIFAHDDQRFGDGGDESIVKCGTWTGSGGAATIDLGWEPQWVMTKCASGTGAWFVFDNLRRLCLGNDAYIRPDTNVAEDAGSDFIEPHGNGFSVSNLGDTQNFIYMAIRRPMKTPEAGTDVFKTINYSGSGAAVTRSTGILVDAIISQRTNGGTPYFLDRLREHGQEYNATNSHDNVGSQSTSIIEMRNDSLKMGSGAVVNGSGNTYNLQLFKRAPGFFDIACYTGTGSSQTVYHNLGVTPELVIMKKRGNESWFVHSPSHIASGKHLNMGSDGSEVNDGGSPFSALTSTLLTFDTTYVSNQNSNGANYVAYLFASLPGISKVGSYTGNDGAHVIDCGFTGGARFVLIKCKDGTNNWRLFDTVRGINTVGNDPVLSLNTSDAQDPNKNWLEADSSGFKLNTSDDNVNNDTNTYLYLAIA